MAVGRSSRSALLDLAAVVAAGALIALELPARVELDRVAAEHVGRVRHAPQLDDLERHDPAVVAVALEPVHALDLATGEHRHLLDRAAHDLRRLHVSVRAGLTSHGYPPPLR